MAAPTASGRPELETGLTADQGAIPSGVTSRGPIKLTLCDAPQRLFLLAAEELYRSVAGHLEGLCTAYALYVEERFDHVGSGPNDYSIKNLAAEYVRRIEREQPHGPYHVAGISFGGLVAYEVAQQLRARGKAVHFIGLIDALVPRAGWRGMRYTLKRFQSLSLTDVSAVLNTYRKGLKEVPGRDEGLTPEQNVREAAHLSAARTYAREIKPWPGTVTVIASGERLAESPVRGSDCCWSCYTPKLDVHIVQAAHDKLLHEPGASEVASVIAQGMLRPS